MKKVQLPITGNLLLLPALLLLFFSSCTSTTSLRVLQPAEMKLPDHISKVATIDRSKPSKGFVNVLEGLFTGEAINQDRRGRENALDGLTYSLTRTPRFEVKPTDVIYEGSSAGGSMAPPLPWPEIDRICNNYGADAVLAIESYDSDIFSNSSSYEEKYKDKEGVERVRVRWRADAEVGVRIGWRFYDPKNKIILDEFTAFANDRFSATGNSRQQALNNLPDLAYRTFDVSRAAGELYGMRVAPVWVNVGRTFFTKGKKGYKEDMKQAARYANSGAWERAAGVWSDLVASADTKTAGRAAHNMAVASEVSGKLDLALEWANKAYQDFNNKASREYIYILEQRMNDERKVDYQLKRDQS
jgi:hypothetical protein